MVIDRAEMAPVVSALPLARAHLPTARSVDDAGSVVVNVVEAVRVTVTLDAALVTGLTSLIVTSEPLTAVTEPDAIPNCPLPNGRAPTGRLPVPGVDPPPPPGLVPRAPLLPKPPEQVPETGCETETVVAVTGMPKPRPPDEEPELGFPNAEMQEPTVTAVADAGTVWRNMVLGV
ncbi:MAG TPA: hypothetical protein VMV06_00675 [Acidimicrobiales bacterium]|nr:hypothetical protein [Acidimicrobiales bacterium]